MPFLGRAATTTATQRRPLVLPRLELLPRPDGAASLLTEVHDGNDQPPSEFGDDTSSSLLERTQPLQVERHSAGHGTEDQATLPMPVGGLLR